MIVDVHKVLIYGAQEELDQFFLLAQRAGFMEFIGLSHKKSAELTEEMKTMLQAISIAKKHAIHPDEALALSGGALAIAQKLVECNAQHEQLFEEKRMLALEIARVAPFGDFDAAELRCAEQESKRVIQFFCNKHEVDPKPLPPELIYLSTEYDLDYFVAINKTRTQYPEMIEIVIERPLGELKQRLNEVDSKSALIEREIRGYSNNLPLFQQELLHLLNEHQLVLTKRDAASFLDNSLFAIEAWIPTTRMKALDGLLSGLKVTVEEIQIESSDKIPTYMENKGAARIGEDLVHIYDTPASTDKDPSLWVLIFFALFFAMIVSDAGYGLLYLGITLFCKWKFPNLKSAGRRLIKLAIILSSACILWGLCSASFFGIDIGPNNPYRRISVMHYLATKKAEYHVEKKDDVYEESVREYPATKDAIDGHDFLVKGEMERNGKIKYPLLETFYDNIFLELSLLIGIVHLSSGLFRYMFRNWANLGWVLFMVGGYLYFPKMLNATTIFNFMGILSKETAYAWGIQIIWCGMGLAFIGAFLQKKWGAFHEMMNVIQIFGDVLSYIRIYALALAGMMVASTFNSMGQSVGFIGGIFIIIAGHLVNVVLSIMGGMIHGLRLNFLEWYHYCFEGGGRLFNPLRLRK